MNEQSSTFSSHSRLIHILLNYPPSLPVLTRLLGNVGVLQVE